MEDLKQLTNKSDVLQLSKALQKIALSIEEQKKDKTKKESAIQELVFLKEQCQSNNIQLSLLSSQTLYGLVENGVLDAADVLTMFLTMVTNANNPLKIGIFGEGIINVLLLDLRIASHRLQPNDSYVCPFGMKTAQHPIITLIHKKNVDMLDLASKLNGICSHFDQHIKTNRIEFLRPVFLHIFCNPVQIMNAELFWMVFLKQLKQKIPGSQTLLHEIFAWCRVSPERCLGLSMQLIDITEYFLETGDINSAFQYQVYLIALVLSLIEYGHDPRNALDTIAKTLQRDMEQSMKDSCFESLLIATAHIIRCIAPFYLRDALEVVKVLVGRRVLGNAILRNMILDSLIIRLAINGKCLPPRVSANIERLMKQIQKLKLNSADRMENPKSIENETIEHLKYFHPATAMNANIARLSTKLCTDANGTNTETLKRIIQYAQINGDLADQMHFFLRAVLLSVENHVPLEMWMDILELLLGSVDTKPNISGDTIYFILYLLAKETDGHKQIALMRGLTKFATAKENIPLILNTYRSLSSSSKDILKVQSVDLYTRLWLVENRVYQFLHKVLIADDEIELATPYRWEMNIVKAHAIKEICSHKASQHGTDLVAPLSKILNRSVENDLARALALQAVVLLCRSQTVNVVSTWNVLKNTFNSNLKSRTLKSLCEFFGEVPLLKSSTNEYDMLFREAITQLWTHVTTSKDVEIIRSALHALRNFNFTELTLEHMPAMLYENIRLPKEYQIQIAASHSDPNSAPLNAASVVPYVPGNCWIELLRCIHDGALNDAIEFITFLIESEMSQYRSGVYMLPDGRPEPKELQYLHDRSPLRAMIKFLIAESMDKTDFQTVLKCLECVAKKYSRPIPPLNWFYLIEYINEAPKFEGFQDDDHIKMKKFALTIAGNQIAHSGSAKALVENYLQSFDTDNKQPDEIQVSLEIVASVSDGVSPQILANFLHRTMTFVYNLSDSSHFEDKCHFEMAIQAIAKIYDKKCLIAENVDIVTDELYRFNDMLHSESKIYDKYSDLIIQLPSEILDKLTTSTDWNSDEHFRKALIVRSKAAMANKPFSTSFNPWMWLNRLIESVVESQNPDANYGRKDLILLKLLNLLTRESYDDAVFAEWIMYFLGIVQANFNQGHTITTTKDSVFALDVFVFCIVVSTGCAIFVDNDISMENRIDWIDTFPEALWLLSERSHWCDCMPRIFEFLYHLNTQQSNLPNEYKSVSCNTLICVKSHQYFLQKNIWNKFISLK